MSWRDILGVEPPPADTPHTHNTHSTQNPAVPGNCADIADSAYSFSENDRSKLLEILTEACTGLSIQPEGIRKALTPEEAEKCLKGDISTETLRGFASALAQRREMDKGKLPAHYTKLANCKHCGTIWLWFSGNVLGCPWCWNG